MNDGGLVSSLFAYLTPDEVAPVVYVDLPPEVEADQEPVDPGRPGREPLAPKRTWRRNKVIQQLVDPIYVAETADLLERQAGDIHSAFQPRNGWQDWLTDTVATIMLRINRSERIERKLRDWASYRAFDFWEEDQKLAVATIALKLAKEPARVVAKLRETPAGIDWLIARWRVLARVEPQDWTDEQSELAARLLGGDAGVDSTGDGFVAARISELEAYREQVQQADAIIRGLVEADLHDDGVPGLAKLRRYVQSLHRQLKWYVDQFHVEHPDRWDDPRRRAASEGRPVEEWRPRNHNHFEGKADTPVVSEPTVAPAIDETKPLRDQSAHQNDETKPFERGKPTVPAPVSFAIEPPVFVHDYSNERGRNHSRALRAGEHSREYARRRKAARRRTNLALAEMT